MRRLLPLLLLLLSPVPSSAGQARSPASLPIIGAVRLRGDLRPRYPKHRVGRDERTRLGRRRPRRRGRQDGRLRRLGERRRLALSRQRDHVPAGVRHGAGAVDRRRRHRSSAPADGLGGHGRGVDAELGLDWRRDLQVHRRRRHVDERRPARVGARSPPLPCTRPTAQTVYACVAGKLWSDSTERGLYKTADGGRTWTLVLKGSNPSTGCASVSLDPAKPRPAVREPLGLPAAGLDVPVRRSIAVRAERQRTVRVRERRADVDVARRRDRERACPPSHGAGWP